MERRKDKEAQRREEKQKGKSYEKNKQKHLGSVSSYKQEKLAMTCLALRLGTDFCDCLEKN